MSLPVISSNSAFNKLPDETPIFIKKQSHDFVVLQAKTEMSMGKQFAKGAGMFLVTIASILGPIFFSAGREALKEHWGSVLEKKNRHFYKVDANMVGSENLKGFQDFVEGKKGATPPAVLGKVRAYIKFMREIKDGESPITVSHEIYSKVCLNQELLDKLNESYPLPKMQGGGEATIWILTRKEGPSRK
jgi:hypothetical protein